MASMGCRFKQGVAVIAMLAGIGLEGIMGFAAMARSEVVVFAAASTTNAVNEIARQFADRYATRVTSSFASSSTLAKQIAGGAPANVYLSANKKWMDYLEKKRLIDAQSRFDLMGNRIVLIAPAGSSLGRIDIGPGLALDRLLGKDGRLSMGDPAHVPAGIYGKTALQHIGIWDRIKHRLAPMKDVRAALVLVERAETPLGLVYGTDAAISKKVRVVGTFPADSHTAIVYPVAEVSAGKKTETTLFLYFLTSPEARAVLVKYGFVIH